MSSPPSDLIEAVVHVVSPQGPDHARAVRALAKAARRVAEDWVVGVQLPVRLGPASEPEPDLYLASGPEERYRSTHPGPEDLVLVIEVSGSTLGYDPGTKLDAYRRSGVAEVWVVDQAGGRLLRFLPGSAVEPQVVTSGVIGHHSGLTVDLW